MLGVTLLHAAAPLDGPPIDAIDRALAALGAVDPRSWGPEAADTMQQLVRDAGDVGADTIEVTVEPADDRTDEALAGVGFVRTREILQLRRPLPLEADQRRGSTPIDLRSFRPGVDDGAWLVVNHRAFFWHPDQGALTQHDLDERLAAPWFEADGFLLAEQDGELAGFCWTKLDTDELTPLGEIYAIGVDPDHQGGGLGRALVLAGLDHLTRVGAGTAMLWVEADNATARSLYDRLGFGLDHAKRYYRRAVRP